MHGRQARGNVQYCGENSLLELVEGGGVNYVLHLFWDLEVALLNSFRGFRVWLCREL